MAHRGGIDDAAKVIERAWSSSVRGTLATTRLPAMLVTAAQRRAPASELRCAPTSWTPQRGLPAASLPGRVRGPAGSQYARWLLSRCVCLCAAAMIEVASAPHVIPHVYVYLNLSGVCSYLLWP
jgi:hypothetical protein